jgi:hypothetical protein
MLDYTPHMTEKQLYEAAYKMRQGGSFACAISDAFFVADKNNRKKLLYAFGDLFVEFAHTPFTPTQGEPA